MFTRIKELREYEDYSMSQIAKKLGVSKGTYSMWEYGKDMIPLPRLIQLANIYHVSLDYLMNFNNNSKSNKIFELDKDIVAKNLFNVRKKLKYSQVEMGLKMNTSRTNVSRYETGKFLISTYPLYELCKNCHLSPENILFNK